MKRDAKYKRLYKSCRQYWNEFDPIGLLANLTGNRPPDSEPGGEYDSYVPHTLLLVLDGADAVKLRKHIVHCCTVNMGLAPNKYDDGSLTRFLEQLLSLQRTDEH